MESINRHILTGGALSEIEYDNLNLNYFTIEALEDGLTASLSINNCDYCVDDDNNWQKLNANESTIAINTGQTICFKGNITPDSTNGIGTFTISKKCNIKGNPLSLIYSYNFNNYINKVYPNNAFKDLFDSCTNIVDASSLELTGIANSESCFSGLFRGCTSLTAAPNLPSMIVGKYSYQHLFQRCTSLITAPELPATTIAYGSYAGMFEGCTNLEKAPSVLPAIDLTGCTYCYQWMFNGCRQLSTAPIILAEKLEEYCYRYMFINCTSLIKAPELPATTLAENCYYNMFNGCYYLTASPKLPATTLADFCYYSMFEKCSNLKEITMLATDISATGCLNGWVIDVASTGTFIKHPSLSIDTIGYGDSGIPTGWAVVDYDYSKDYFTIEALENGLTVKLSQNASQYRINNGDWTYLDANTETPSINIGQKLQFKMTNPTISSSGIGRFTINKKFNVSGNIMSLLYGDNFEGQINLSGKNKVFYQLLYRCTTLKSAKNLVLPATTLADYCYAYMFSNCTILTEVPQLPATTLVSNCYYYMFNSCKSLKTAPELPATTLANNCYSSMFSDCTSLNTAPELPATTLANSCYSSMFSGCTSLTTAPKLHTTTLAPGCYSLMFSRCTSLTESPELPATTLATSCYSDMFNGTNVLPDCSNIDFTNEAVVASGGLQGLFSGTKVTDADLERILPKNNEGKYCLPVTTLTGGCYDGMFLNCKNLETAPELPATTLKSNCYIFMFSGCTLLTTAPELPATTLVSNCYYNMFYGCSKLNYIKMLATNISASNCLNNWVSGVASNGTFVKNAAMTSLSSGDSGIPSGWTVIDYTE